MEQSILNFIQHVYQTLGRPVVVILMIIESACISLPSEIIMPLGWMLIEKAGLSYWYLLWPVLRGAGNVIGSLISYWIGAKGGLPLLRRSGPYIWITHGDLIVPPAGLINTEI